MILFKKKESHIFDDSRNRFALIRKPAIVIDPVNRPNRNTPGTTTRWNHNILILFTFNQLFTPML